MNHYSKNSRDMLNTCHQDLQTIFERVLEFWDHSIICGRRGRLDQDKAFAEGKSKVQWPNSKHNIVDEYGNEDTVGLSLAVDAVPYPVDWDNIDRFIAFGCYVLGVADALYRQGAISHRLRWGGDWNYLSRDLSPQSFNDYPHFELVKP